MDNYEIASVTINKFESIKHIDENGLEFWYAHDLAKALGYSKFSNMINAINRAIEAISKRGIDPFGHIRECKETVVVNNGASREYDGYKMTRMGSYYVAMNGDTSKDEVAAAQAYFIDNTGTIEAIMSRMDDIKYMNSRDSLRIANRQLSSTLVHHDVPKCRIGNVLNQGYYGMFGMSNKALIEKANVPANTNMNDILEPVLVDAKQSATSLSTYNINLNNVRGEQNTGEVIYNIHKDMRDLVNKYTGKNPEDMIPGSNVKSIQSSYNKEVKKGLKDNKFD